MNEEVMEKLEIEEDILQFVRLNPWTGKQLDLQATQLSSLLREKKVQASSHGDCRKLEKLVDALECL